MKRPTKKPATKKRATPRSKTPKAVLARAEPSDEQLLASIAQAHVDLTAAVVHSPKYFEIRDRLNAAQEAAKARGLTPNPVPPTLTEE